MKTNDTGLVIKIQSAAGRGRCIIISSFTSCELLRAHSHESFHAACPFVRKQRSLARIPKIRLNDHASNVHSDWKKKKKKEVF